MGNTVAEIDLFLAWLVDNLQNDLFQNYFRLRTEKIKKYYRVVDELEIVKSNSDSTTFISPPRISAIKYRKSFNNFQMADSVLTYKNDLTWENAMTTPGRDLDYESIEPMPAYQDIFGTKLEANVQVDTCQEDGGLVASPPIYGNSGTGFSAKIEFDDDDSYGTNDTNGLNMIDPTNWGNIQDDDSFYCDCTNPLTPNCLCCNVEMYFKDYCSYFADDSTETTDKEFRLLYGIHYVLDIDFYWYPNGDGYNSSAEHTSKGKLTFQVKYDDMVSVNNDEPSDASTELSVKLYKSKTDNVDSNWDGLTSFAENLIDTITDKSSGASEWIDHSMCTSDTHCCTNLALTTDKWINTCSAYDTQNLCEKKYNNKKGMNQCQWISCSEVGDCENNSGNANFDKKCSRITNQQDCQSKFNGKCDWISRNATPPIVAYNEADNEFIEAYDYKTDGLMNKSGRNESSGNFVYIYYAVIGLFFVLLGYGLFIKCKQTKVPKHPDTHSYTPLLV